MNRFALEWLESDGQGGFSSGTASGVRTRRYHAALVSADESSSRRFVLLNGFDAWIETSTGRIPISTQRYVPDVLSPDGAERLERFESDPWPKWTYRIAGALTVEQELFVPQGSPAAVITWRGREGRLILRPFISGRDYHDLHHRNGAFRFEPRTSDGRLIWEPYPGVPPLLVATNGTYVHAPTWYMNFQYDEERFRGLDFIEDLASPGTFTWDLSKGEAFIIFSTGPVSDDLGRLRDLEIRRRKAIASPLARAGDAYLVRTRRGRGIIAGYPWFGEWSRDTFISLRGLCLSTGRFDDAREILLSWAGALSEGMLPNRHPEGMEPTPFNSVDGSLWFVLAVQEFLRETRPSPEEGTRLSAAANAILESYARGTRHGIRACPDGLLQAGEPGIQLTWMDAKVGEQVMTPRIGKPVEVQALWLRALAGAGAPWRGMHEKGLESFQSRFWNEGSGGLYDVVDVDHVPNRRDASVRPNQILAAGLLDPERARRMIETVESRLLTPAGLRTLAPVEPGYRGRYEGGPVERDGAYHQGTVWPWLLGPFVEAWISARGGSARVKSEARGRFVQPLLERTRVFGLGHLFEIADGDPPHHPRGCPFQAWSTGELLRLDALTR